MVEPLAAIDVPLSFDWFFLALRLAFVAILYLFIWQVLRIQLRELRRSQPAQPRRKPGKAKLVVVDPAESDLAEGSTITISNHATIGRHPDCTVVIEEPFMSAIHAEFVAKQLAWYVLDRESTNGTFINGRQLSGSGYVETDDIIQFGRLKVRFIAPKG